MKWYKIAEKYEKRHAKFYVANSNIDEHNFFVEALLEEFPEKSKNNIEKALECTFNTFKEPISVYSLLHSVKNQLML